MSILSGSSNLFVIFFCTYLYGMSGSNPSSHQQSHNMDRSENKRRRPLAGQPHPVACRVCDRVFFDNASLVLHFDESHDFDEILLPVESDRILAHRQSHRLLSLNPPQFSYSSAERTSKANFVAALRMNGYPRPCPMPVNSAKTHNILPGGLNLDEIPVLNSMPSLSSPSDAQRKLSKSTFCSSVSLKEKIKKREMPVSSSLGRPLFNSKFGHKVARGFGAEPLWINEQGVGGCFFNTRSREPYKEVIIISDEEEEANKSPAKTLDLTLRL